MAFWTSFRYTVVTSAGETAIKQIHRLTAIIEREDDGYVSLCPELDLASQGRTIEEARSNLVEALELFYDTADPSEIQQRLGTGRTTSNG